MGYEKISEIINGDTEFNYIIGEIELCAIVEGGCLVLNESNISVLTINGRFNKIAREKIECIT